MTGKSISKCSSLQSLVVYSANEFVGYCLSSLIINEFDLWLGRLRRRRHAKLSF